MADIQSLAITSQGNNILHAPWGDQNKRTENNRCWHGYKEIGTLKKDLAKHVMVCFSSNHVSDNTVAESGTHTNVRCRNGVKLRYHSLGKSLGQKEGKEREINQADGRLLTLTVSQGKRNKSKNKWDLIKHSHVWMFPQSCTDVRLGP